MAAISRSSNHAGRLFAGALLVALLGSVSLSAMAQGDRHGPGHHGPAAAGMGMGIGMPMQGRMLERMLDRVNATAEQRAQIKQIAERTATDMKAQHDSSRGLRGQAATLFAQPVVDANAAEALRLQMMQQHDQRSRRVMQAMLEVSRVLTPDQRKQLAETMARRGDMMRRHMQERQSLDGTMPKR
ncbi:MAG: Spy/CpxP family protein refolding chaperone [Burkholderiaceae bacterium]